MELKKIKKMNKKADLLSLLYIVVLIFVIGVVFVMSNNLNNRLFLKIEQNLNESKTLNESTAIPAIQKIRTKENVMWDYGFLGIFMGAIIALGLTAYSTRISPVFYWIYGIISLVVLMVAVILSNTWQKLAENPQTVDTITRFPITNFILGTYYPTIFTAILILFMVLLFGKTSDNSEGLV